MDKSKPFRFVFAMPMAYETVYIQENIPSERGVQHPLLITEMIYFARNQMRALNDSIIII